MLINFTGDTSEILGGIDVLADDLDFTVSDEGFQVIVNRVSGSDLIIKADEKCATITFDRKIHFYRALSLFCQHIKAGESVFSINEKPMFDTVGAMFDVSQGNAVIKVTEVKKLLRMMAQMGLDVLMLYCEDSFKVENQPYFGYMRPGYSRSDLKECDDYAYMLGIEMIPCVQTLAHLVDVLKWNVYDDIRENDVCLLPEDDRTYDFIRDVLISATRPFRSRRVHIGMDEAYNLGRGPYLDRHGFVPVAEIMKKHLSKVLEIVKELGLKPMMWSDMFFSGYGYYGDRMLPKEVADCVPDDVQLVYWDYYHNDEHSYEVNLARHRSLEKKMNGKDTALKTIFAGGIWTWIGPAPHWKRTFLSTQAALSVCKREGVREVFVTIWGDNGTEAFYTVNMPGLALYAEHGYSEKPDEKKLKNRFEFITGANFNDFMTLEELDAVPGVSDEDMAISGKNPSKFLLWQDVLTGLFDKNIRGLPLNAHYAALAEKLEPMQYRNGSFNHIFRFSHLLAKVLEIKSELGLRITDAYKSEDKTELSRIADEDLPELFVRMSELRTCHMNHWFEMYKSTGWDVMDMRYGSLLARISSAITEIGMYLDGEIDRLEELEPERLDYNGHPGMPDYVNWFGRIVSASRIAPYC